MISVGGVVVIGEGGGGPSLSSATPAALGVAAAGVSADASRADHVHAAPVQAYSDGALSTASDTGWTLRDGSGTAAITGGVARLTLGSGVVPGAWASIPAAIRAHSCDPWDVDARVRLAAITGGSSSDVYVSFGLRRGSAGSAGIFFNLRGDGGDSSIFRDSIAGTGALVSGITIDRTAMAAGTLWLRVASRGGVLFAAWGTGVGTAEPTDWAAVYSGVLLGTPGSYLSQVIVGLDAIGGGSPDAVTVDWAGFRVKGSAP